MNPMLAVTIIKPTPTPTPVPTHGSSPSPDIFSFLLGSGAVSFLLVLMILVLIGGGITVLMMFKTGRWQVAKSSANVGLYPGNLPQRAMYPGTVPAVYPSVQQGESISGYIQSLSAASSVAQTEQTALQKRTEIFEDPLKNTRWIGLVEECVELYDELDRHSPSLDPSRQGIARHIKYRLKEILNRAGVVSISRDSTFDENRHQIESSSSLVAEGTPITEIVSPGFIVGERVLLRAKVRVAST